MKDYERTCFSFDKSNECRNELCELSCKYTIKINHGPSAGVYSTNGSTDRRALNSVGWSTSWHGLFLFTFSVISPKFQSIRNRTVQPVCSNKLSTKKMGIKWTEFAENLFFQSAQFFKTLLVPKDPSKAIPGGNFKYQICMVMINKTVVE